MTMQTCRTKVCGRSRHFMRQKWRAEREENRAKLSGGPRHFICQTTMLSALGVWPDGHWEIVHWQIASGENETTWTTFFGQLYAKGMTEETTQLVGSDGAQGLEGGVGY